MEHGKNWIHLEPQEQAYIYQVQYREYQQHPNKVIYGNNKLIVTWLFALNTGGLIAMAKTTSQCPLLRDCATLGFFIGIILIYLSIKIEMD